MNQHIAVLPGDGIGPEVMAVTLQLLEQINIKHKTQITHSNYLVGGAAIDNCGTPLPQATIDGCQNSNAILFGSVSGSKWENIPTTKQPERGALYH